MYFIVRQDEYELLKNSDSTGFHPASDAEIQFWYDLQKHKKALELACEKVKDHAENFGSKYTIQEIIQHFLVEAVKERER